MSSALQPPHSRHTGIMQNLPYLVVGQIPKMAVPDPIISDGQMFVQRSSGIPLFRSTPNLPDFQSSNGRLRFGTPQRTRFSVREGQRSEEYSESTECNAVKYLCTRAAIFAPTTCHMSPVHPKSRTTNDSLICGFFVSPHLALTHGPK